MEPATRIPSHKSTKSYLQRDLIVSLNNNDPSLDVMGSQHEERLSSASSSATEVGTIGEERRWWCKPRDNSDPKLYPRYKKNLILMLVSIAGAISPISTTLYFPALVTMQDDFQTTDTVMNASLSIFTFFTAFFPLVWATFGDLFGRRRIYIISFFISFVGSICCGISVNAEMFIIFRAFSAIGSSSAMSMGAGTIADIFESHERGKAFAYYACGPLVGPAIGPIIGGYLNQAFGWRSDFYFLAIFGFLTWLGIVFGLPETWRASSLPAPMPEKSNVNDTNSEKSAKAEFSEDVEAQQKEQHKKRNFINPIAALKLLLFPNIALAVIFVGVLFFVLYLNNTNFTRSYTLQYGLSSGIVGICYLPAAAGSMIGGVLGGRMSDNTYNRKASKAQANGMEVYPEMRLGGAIMYGTILLQLFGFIAYGWCLEKNVHFAYGLVCQFIIGFSLMFPNIALSAYMIDCFRKQSASVTACNNFARYIMAGVGSLIASEILRALGNGILSTFCGAILAIASINLVIIRKYAFKWTALRKAYEK